jgi:hypothetical protein
VWARTVADPWAVTSHRTPCLPDTIRLILQNLSVPRALTITCTDGGWGGVRVGKYVSNQRGMNGRRARLPRASLPRRQGRQK